MKRFLVKVVVWLLIFSLAVFLLNLGFEKRLEQCSNRTMIEHCPEYDLLIVGSSRAKYHIDPYVMDSILGVNSFNIGIDNSQIDYHTVRIQHYLSLCAKPPSTIIWCIDFMTMGQSVGYASDFSFPFAFYNKEFAKALIQESEFYKDVYGLTFGALPQYLFHRYLWNRQLEFPSLIVSNMKNGSKGYFGLCDPWDGTAFNIIDTINAECHPQTKIIFEKELGVLEKDGINVILVYTPLFYQVLDKIVNLNEQKRVTDSIASHFNIPILDYTSCYLSKDSSYFCNAQHLNSQGSKLFSEMLARNLDSLSLISTKRAPSIR